MAEFGVDVEKILTSSERIKNSVVKINELGNNLDEIRKAGVFFASYGSVVDQSMRQQFDAILSEAAKMDSFGTALQLIADKYDETEKRLVGIVSGEGISINGNENFQESASRESNEDNRNWFQKFWDWITGKDADNHEPSPQEQEKAADDSMRNQLRDVLNDKKYSRKNWKNASIEERKQILQDYMNEVIRIYGLQDVDPNLTWDSSATYERGRVTWGYYSPKSHMVTLNENVLSDRYGNWNSYDLLETISHELRHAYQHEAVDNPGRFMVSQETINTWRDNINNYRDSDTYGYDAYYSQPIEVDARSFQVRRSNWREFLSWFGWD